MKYSTATSPVPVLPPAEAVLGTTWANTVGTAAAGADRVGWELSEEDIGGFRGGGGGRGGRRSAGQHAIQRYGSLSVANAKSAFTPSLSWVQFDWSTAKSTRMRV